jgi:hypothetical protein
MAFLAAPAIALLVALVRPRTYLRWRLYPAVVLAGMTGLTIHLFLPLRAELRPVINEGAPECESIASALGSVLSYGRAGCAALSASLNREQYQKPPLLQRLAPLKVQLLNYVQYFDWQWARAFLSRPCSPRSVCGVRSSTGAGSDRRFGTCSSCSGP